MVYVGRSTMLHHFQMSLLAKANVVNTLLKKAVSSVNQVMEECRALHK